LILALALVLALLVLVLRPPFLPDDSVAKAKLDE